MANKELFVRASIPAVLVILILSSILMGDQVIIAPSEDAYIVTFGGGEGCNPFLKYNIAAVLPGVVIDSVFLQVYVWEIGSAWDGDANYWNVNNQTWTEADSAKLLWNSPTSDSTYQSADFGTAIGWTQSVDIKDIFLADYNLGNTFMSLKIKDPDDPTFMPQPGSYPFDYDDTLALGNWLFDEHIIFYPHEYPNAPPWLVVYYHAVGINETFLSGTKSNKRKLDVYPNPFFSVLNIAEPKTDIKLYNSEGRFLAIFTSGTIGQNLRPGIYFLKAEGYKPTKIVKLQ